MLKKRDRLTKKQFDQFFKTGRRKHSPLMQLIYTPHESFHGAAVAGKKVFKRAVDRNRLRRRLYHLLYQEKKRYDLTGVYIIIAKPTAKAATYAELKSELIALVGHTSKKS